MMTEAIAKAYMELRERLGDEGIKTLMSDDAYGVTVWLRKGGLKEIPLLSKSPVASK